MKQQRVWTIKETTPNAAGTVASKEIGGLDRFGYLMIDAKLAGPANGTLDVYLQRKIVEEDGTAHWVDWVHFATVTAGAAAAWFTLTPTASSGIVSIGAETSPGLAANTVVGGHPGSRVRALWKSGTGTTAGAEQMIQITGIGSMIE